jgi:molybdopterin molybdotransferase
MTAMSAPHDTPWVRARQLAASRGCVLASESVPLERADRRILAEDVRALVDLPGFDSSAMDGWAVRGHGPWQPVGSVLAGDALPATLADGTAVRIATGAPVPDGTSGIVRWEKASTLSDGRIDGGAVAGDIRRRGEECRAGDLLAGRGGRLTPPLLGLLAGAGHDELPVVAKPRVRLVLMGDELLEHGLPQPGQVRDAIGPQLPAWLDRAGAMVVDTRRLSDDLGLLITALTDVGVDLIISTGGTAAGPSDHVHAAVEAAGGRFVIDGVAVRPGHPMALAELGPGRPPLIALPGNPQAAVVGLLTLALPLLSGQSGVKFDVAGEVVLAEDLKAPDNQTRMVGGQITSDGFRRSTHAGSAMLRGLAASTGYAVIPPGGAPAGSLVEWVPLA